MIYLTFLGSGSAFTTGQNNFHSNALLSCNDDTLLIDCGSDIRHSLCAQGKDYKAIKNVYISHLHADHAGGLEWLGLTTYFDSTCKSVNLYANHNVMKLLWKHTLSGGMTTLQNKIAKLDDFFNVCSIADNNSFQWQNIDFTLIQMIHVMSGFCLMPTYGLTFTIGNTKILFTADTQFTRNQLMPFYLDCDLIFHDCETSKNPSGVHANYAELKTLPIDIKNKTWLYHYNTSKLPDAEKDGFLGFVQPGQTFKLTT